MSDIRYYTDEHVAHAVARGLRQRGIDVLTVVEAQKLGASDDEQLAFALSEGRVFFTHDDDFLSLAAEGQPHAGIVYAVNEMSIGDVVRGLTLIAQVLTAEEIVGQIEFL